jgi:hypothetical protein
MLVALAALLATFPMALAGALAAWLAGALATGLAGALATTLAAGLAGGAWLQRRWRGHSDLLLE